MTLAEPVLKGWPLLVEAEYPGPSLTGVPVSVRFDPKLRSGETTGEARENTAELSPLRVCEKIR